MKSILLFMILLVSGIYSVSGSLPKPFSTINSGNPSRRTFYTLLYQNPSPSSAIKSSGLGSGGSCLPGYKMVNGECVPNPKPNQTKSPIPMPSPTPTTTTWLATNATKREDPPEDFSELKLRKSPIYACPDWDREVLWQIPNSPNCDIVHSNETAQVMSTTLWWPIVTSQSINATECFAKKSEYIRDESWTGVQTEYDINPVDYPVTLEECRKMLQTFESPTGKTLSLVAPTLFSDQESVTELAFKWNENKRYNRISYYLRKVKIQVPPSSQLVESSAHTNKPCTVLEAKCPLVNHGWLIWNKDEYKPCQLKQGKTTACALLKNKHLICPQEQFLFSNIRLATECSDLEMLSSDQGVSFTTSNGWQNTKTTAQVASFLELPKKRNINRRSAQEFEELQFGNSESVGAQLSFLVELARNHSESFFSDIFHRICVTSKMLQDLAVAEAQFGDPTTLIQMYFGQGFRARWNGDHLGVLQCHEIRHYKLGVNTNTTAGCTIDMPITYALEEDGVSRDGFLTPELEIVHFSTPVDCSMVPSFYFEYDTEIYLDNTRMDISTLPVMPFDPSPHNMDQMPEIAVYGEGIFNHSSHTSIYHTPGDLSLHEMHQSVRKTGVAAKAIGSFASNHPSNEQSDREQLVITNIYRRLWISVAPSPLIGAIIIIIIILIIAVFLSYFKLRDQVRAKEGKSCSLVVASPSPVL